MNQPVAQSPVERRRRMPERRRYRGTVVAKWWSHWWRRQAPAQQDRFAVLAPLAAVLLFLAAIVTAFWYLRLEEHSREEEAMQRDVEYSQQQIRLRLLQRQEQLMTIARDVSTKAMDPEEFVAQAETLIVRYPELQVVSWIDSKTRIIASYAAPSISGSQLRIAGERLTRGSETEASFSLTRDLRQPVYALPSATSSVPSALQLHMPLQDRGQFAGVVLAEYSGDGLLRFGLLPETAAKYAISLIDAKGKLIAGTSLPNRSRPDPLQPWTAQANSYEVPVSPVGNGMVLRAQAYRTSLGVVGGGLFWLVVALSAMTAWMLVANWRHTRRRMRAQHELVTEMNFRRAMENSMPTGLRVLDLSGRITYVNAAFCLMSGWPKESLVGCAAPFPYWPSTDVEKLALALQQTLRGKVSPAGLQMRVQRADGKQFDARMYVSPLIDADGVQTGWLSSMTDISEPNRIRDQLAASHARFVAVLEALDASVSVAPLGSRELLFANKRYRQWFDNDSAGHMGLVAQAGVPRPEQQEELTDDVDTLAGLPQDEITSGQSENAEVFVSSIDKWLEVRSRYLTWVDGRLAQMVIATDITPRRKAEALSAAQAERAQAASRLITMGEMASSVAHELNQPLTAIANYCNGMVSRIKDRKMTEPDLLGALEKTARQAQRAGQIIARIKSFVKRSEPNRSLSSVQTMVNEAVELAEIELRRRNVRLTQRVSPGLPKVLVDPILIEQVLVNLLKNAAESIDNARRAPAQRNVELTIEPCIRENQSTLEFAVLDSGSGLAAEIQERVYEAFFSTKAEGMGIGLNLCRSIVESHHGRMQAENIYNDGLLVGCRFSFWLPLAAQEHISTLPEQPNTGVSA
jgi:PAS domain S-box-containing protein